MYEQYVKIIKERLSSRRYHHSICVAKAARQLAERFGGDAERAYLCGVLHDICKNESDEKLLQLVDEFGIMLDNIQCTEPKLWHAIAGAGYIKNVLQLQDNEVIDAVYYHTTGRADMTQLDKLLFLADFISDDRDFDGVESLRDSAKHGLDYAVFRCLIFSIVDLCRRGKAVHPDTLAAYNQLSRCVKL